MTGVRVVRKRITGGCVPLTLDFSLCFKPPLGDLGTICSELSPLPVPSVLGGCRWGEAVHPRVPLAHGSSS